MFKQRRKVRVYIDGGPTIVGILERRTRHTYVLWAPKIVTGENPDAAVDVSGHVEVPRERVLFYQVIS